MSLTKVIYPMIEDFTNIGANAVGRNLQNKVRDIISVLDYGADPTGLTDSTTAIANALADCLDIGVEGGGVQLYFPKGTYLCTIEIDGQNQNDVGEYSLTLNGYGATLKGRAGDTSIIKINGAEATVPDPNPAPGPGGNIYVNGLVIQGFTLDMSDMLNTANTYAIAAQHSYACVLRDVGVLGDPALGGGLFLGSQTYTWTVQNFACNRVNLKGFNVDTNLSSVHNFYNCDFVQVVLENVFNIGFYGGVVQGSLDHFVLVNGVQNLSVFGMDLEGPNTGEVVYKINTNCRYITSVGNTCGGYTVDSYSSGFAPNSNFQDRPNIAGLNGLGVYGRAISQGGVPVNSASTPIFYFKDTASDQNFALFLIAGDNGNDGFQDLIMVAFGVVTIVKSQDVYGSPAVRSYTNTSNTLFATYATGTTAMRPVALEFLMSIL
jgi:hypothetical protein